MYKPFKIGRSYALARSPAGTRIAALGRFVFVWDVRERKKLFRCHPLSHPLTACFSPNGVHLAIKNTAGRIVIVAADDGRTVADFENESDGEGSNVAYSACGEFLVDGSWDGCLRVRQAIRGQTVFEETFPQEMICAVHRDGAGQRWIVEHQPITPPSEKLAPPAYFSVWEWPFRKKMHSVLPCRFDHLYSSALSHDGAFLAVVRGGNSAVMEVHGLPNASLQRALPINVGGTASALRWSPDGKWLGSVQRNRTAIYRIPELSCVAEFPLSYPSDISFCPELNVVALGDWQQGFVAPVGW